MRMNGVNKNAFTRKGSTLRCSNPRGFTLVELLVVISIIAMLMTLLVPILVGARDSGRQVVCASNLRQIAISALMYSGDNDSYFPPAHTDFYTVNNHRWHGTRPASDKPFDFESSSLNRILKTVRIKECPSFVFDESAGFERSCGGYGYNSTFVGSSLGDPALIAASLPYEQFEKRAGNVPARQAQIARPAEKIFFSDSAMAFPSLIEYSFVEPPRDSWGNETSPSMHFRHKSGRQAGSANVAWVDGHVTGEQFEWTYRVNIYGADNAANRLGFFGPRDNRFFERK